MCTVKQYVGCACCPLQSHCNVHAAYLLRRMKPALYIYESKQFSICIMNADGRLCQVEKRLLHLAATLTPCLQTFIVVQALAKCHKLEVVNFTWCVQLTDTAVCSIAAGCTGLQSLSSHGLRGITNQTIEALAANCRDSLHTLDVHGCIGIKSCEEPVQSYLQRNLPGVKQFVVHT